MKARIGNGQIVVYPQLPLTFKNDKVSILGGMEYLSKEELEELGFYDIIEPVLTENEIYGAPKWDEGLNSFIYEKISKPVPPILTNQLIALQREHAYKAESDSLYMAWQKYIALCEAEKAEEKRIAWLSKVAEIDARYPYN